VEPRAPATFVSYARADSAFALSLSADLKRAGANVWIDQIDLEPGKHWDSAIEEAVAKAPRMLLVLSPTSVISQNVRNEITFALEENKTIIPVLYQQCVIPLQLRRIHYIDFRTDYAQGLTKLLNALGVEIPVSGSAIAATALKPRVVDAAIPSDVVKDLGTELLVLIRLPDSPGLHGILQEEEEFGAHPEDVRSKSFSVVFPLGPTGRPEPLRVTVKVTSPDFSPPDQSKNIFVPPEKDSEVCSFVLTPRRVGRLTVLVELEWEDAVRGHRSLLTRCVAEATKVPAAEWEMNLVQMHVAVGTGSAGASTGSTEPSSHTGSVVPFPAPRVDASETQTHEKDGIRPEKALAVPRRMMQGHWAVRDEDGIHRVHAEIIWGFPHKLTITWDGIALESLGVGFVAGDLRSFQRSGHLFQLSDKGVGIFDKLDAVGIFGKLVLFMDGVEVPRMEDSKKEAKKLLHDLKKRDAAALRRYQAAFQPVDRMPEPSLEGAQHVIAGERGFANWRELMEYLDSAGSSNP
jgi:hypothetical protein